MVALWILSTETALLKGRASKKEKLMQQMFFALTTLTIRILIKTLNSSQGLFMPSRQPCWTPKMMARLAPKVGDIQAMALRLKCSHFSTRLISRLQYVNVPMTCCLILGIAWGVHYQYGKSFRFWYVCELIPDCHT